MKLGMIKSFELIICVYLDAQHMLMCLLYRDPSSLPRLLVASLLDKAYTLFDPTTKKVIVLRDVMFGKTESILWLIFV